MGSIFFRVDSSYEIGSGHIMRCLSLAIELRQLGKKVEFITREHQGNINEQIIKNNFTLHLLPPLEHSNPRELIGYEKWLRVKQGIDASETIQILKKIDVDWLVIDHYGIDYSWEKILRPFTKKIMVIDDLANRKHDCDLLLDQNYIHNEKRYSQLIAPETERLLGPKYALLRREFSENINSRCRQGEIKKIFVYFGASDLKNLTNLAIKVLTKPKLKQLSVDIVIGSSNKHRFKIEEDLEAFPNIKLHTQIDNIAELMLKADLALGAGGASTWERIALGLPSIIITIADNQIAFTKDLFNDGYINWLGSFHEVNEQIIYDALIDSIANSNQVQKQSQKCQMLVNVKGAKFVSRLLTDDSSDVPKKSENLS